MTNLIRLSAARRLTAVLGLAFGFAGAQAATTNWSANFSGCAGGTVATSGAWSASTATSCPSETGGVDVQVGGLSWTYVSANNYTPGNASVVNYTSGVSNGVTYLGGLGVTSAGETNTTGPHAVDNVDRYDSIVAKFSTAVSLNSLSIGWNGTDNPTTTNGYTYNDSDIGVFAWTGATPPAGSGPTSLSPIGGWTLVAQLNNVGASNGVAAGGAAAGGSATGFNTSNVTSSYWMIAAYGTQDCNYDAFKLLSLAGTVTTTTPGTKVPEPGSLALAGLTVLGVAAIRRRKQDA